jgi:hypothetical protein
MLWLGCVVLAPAFGASAAMVVDRGLPTGNVNNVSDPSRSNVRWSWYDHGFVGDDFTVGGLGERWVIDGIRTWTVPGTQSMDPEHIGDLYQDVRLYFGGEDSGLTPVASATLASGSDETGTPNIQLTPVAGAGTTPYNEFGKDLRTWQVDFQNLNLAVEGGKAYRFGVWGMGRPIPGRDGKSYAWFNHASNAELSIAAQDGADGQLMLFDSGGRFEGTFQGKGSGWDKPADINVQVFAHRVDP